MKSFWRRTKWFWVFLLGVTLLLVVLLILGFTNVEFFFLLWGMGIGLILGFEWGYGQAMKERDRIEREKR